MFILRTGTLNGACLVRFALVAHVASLQPPQSSVSRLFRCLLRVRGVAKRGGRERRRVAWKGCAKVTAVQVVVLFSAFATPLVENGVAEGKSEAGRR